MKPTELKGAPSLHQGESTVTLPLAKANPETAPVFFLPQDYLLITHYSLSQTEIKPLLLPGIDSCAGFLEVYLHLLLTQQRSAIRAPHISKKIYKYEAH